jgi:hypothetical protein
MGQPRTSARSSVRSTEEKDFQKKVTDLCDYLHLKWHHETDSRRSKKGFPDLLIAGPGGVLFVELKSAKGKTTAEQEEWLDKLDQAGATVYVWRPADFEDAALILKQLARP